MPGTPIADISEILLMAGLSGTVTDEERSIALQCQHRAEGAVRRYLQYDPVWGTRKEYYPNYDYTRDHVGVYEVTDTEAYLRNLSDASTEELQVRHLPIRSITTVKVNYDGRAGTRTFNETWVEGTDYWPNNDIKEDSSGNRFCSDGIIRSEGRWPTRPGSVEITYISGYTEDELYGRDTVIDASPITEAVVDEAVRRIIKVYSRKKRPGAGFSGPLASENMGKYSYSVDTSARTALALGGDILASNMEKLEEFVNYGWALAS